MPRLPKSVLVMLNVAKHYSSQLSNSVGFIDYHSVKPTLQLGQAEALKAGTDDEDHQGSSGSPGRSNKKSVNLRECKTKLTEHFQYAM